MARPAPLLSSVVLARLRVSLFIAPAMESAVWSLNLPTAARPLSASTVVLDWMARSCSLAALSIAPLMTPAKAATVNPAAMPASAPLAMLAAALILADAASTMPVARFMSADSRATSAAMSIINVPIFMLCNQEQSLSRPAARRSATVSSS